MLEFDAEVPIRLWVILPGQKMRGRMPPGTSGFARRRRRRAAAPPAHRSSDDDDEQNCNLAIPTQSPSFTAHQSFPTPHIGIAQHSSGFSLALAISPSSEAVFWCSAEADTTQALLSPHSSRLETRRQINEAPCVCFNQVRPSYRSIIHHHQLRRAVLPS
jgi:hypothetical protein